MQRIIPQEMQEPPPLAANASSKKSAGFFWLCSMVAYLIIFKFEQMRPICTLNATFD
jgi:hypothetical protein